MLPCESGDVVDPDGLGEEDGGVGGPVSPIAKQRSEDLLVRSRNLTNLFLRLTSERLLVVLCLRFPARLSPLCRL